MTPIAGFTCKHSVPFASNSSYGTLRFDSTDDAQHQGTWKEHVADSSLA